MILAITFSVTTAATAGLTVLSLALGLCFMRLVRGPSLADRVVALDLMAILLVGLLVLHGIAVSQPESLRIATVLALINFLGTIGFAIYLQRKALA